ncbi:MAG TPA: APC family permease [Patescibacteria group bacterium]|nr:APC family permease [Patescibacteria group bacterium]
MSKHNPAKSSTKENARLGQWFATAICGNDILSSALYVSGISIIYAGIYSPLVLLLIGLVLFFYKSVYIEVVEALPTNGGAYNCLLNATSKNIAAIAGTMTFLSYVATAVISGEDGVQYLHAILAIPIIPVTIGILLLFSLLVVSGIKDSAKVALGIFVFHVITLILFVLFGFWYVTHHQLYLQANFLATAPIVTRFGGILPAIFFGFCASLLGVSGFESSANFVEEQQRGVFRKTLRNMLIGSIIFNPLTAFIALSVMPYHALVASSDFLLSNVARITGGVFLEYLVVIDATIVLSGAVLTAFVGVSGLLYRMTADGCFPTVLSYKNKQGSYPIIILFFFLLTSSILLATKGNLLSLAGVYTIAFLSVMTFFAFGNLLMRRTRRDLKRTYSAPFLFVVFAFCATIAGIIGNIDIAPENLQYFLMYFVPTILLVFATIYADIVLRFIIKYTILFPLFRSWIRKRFATLIDGEFVVFVYHPNRLFQILQYIYRNEIGKKIILIYCDNWNLNKKENEKQFTELEKIIPTLREAGVYPDFSISLLHWHMSFGKVAVDDAVKKMHVPHNRILIGSIHHDHPFDYDDLGGVRIIF